MEADPQMILIIELLDKDFIIGIIHVKENMFSQYMKR